MKTSHLISGLALAFISAGATAQQEGSIPSGFHGGYSSIRGVRLHYVKGGSGPLVLLVNGFGQDWYKWHGLMPLLNERGFTVVAVDLPGLGKSESPKGDFTGQNTSTYLYDFARSLSPGVPFNLIAHDIGVWNTYPMVAQHPSDFRSVIFMEAPIPDRSFYDHPAFAPTGESLLWHFSFFAAKDRLLNG